jgi:hypothetical protein
MYLDGLHVDNLGGMTEGVHTNPTKAYITKGDGSRWSANSGLGNSGGAKNWDEQGRTYKSKFF